MKKFKKFDFDTIVVGSGAGGSIAAHLLAGEGQKVAIVEEGKLGGDSVNYSEIPKLSLMESLRRFTESKNNHDFGVRTPSVMYNYPSVIGRMTNVKNAILPVKEAFSEDGITTIRGSLRFMSKHEVQVDEDFYTAKNFIVASGSRPNIPEIEGIEEAEVYDRKSILDIKSPPRSLAIIGSDAAAVEYANLFQILGSKVTVFTTEPQLLPDCDKDVSGFVESRLTQKGVDLRTSSQVTRLSRVRGRTTVTYLQGPDESEEKFDEVLISCGDQPALNLGLESLKVSYNGSGIRVNQYMQTSSPHVFAIGGCVEVDTPHHLTCEQARIAVHNLLESKKKLRASTDSSAAKIISIDPEISLIGMSEFDASNEKVKIKVFKSPMSIVPKAFVAGSDLGFVKLICLPSGQIVGAAIISAQAREMTLPLVLAVDIGLNVAELSRSLVPFGAFSEAIRQAAMSKPHETK